MKEKTVDYTADVVVNVNEDKGTVKEMTADVLNYSGVPSVISGSIALLISYFFKIPSDVSIALTVIIMVVGTFVGNWLKYVLPEILKRGK